MRLSRNEIRQHDEIGGAGNGASGKDGAAIFFHISIDLAGEAAKLLPDGVAKLGVLMAGDGVEIELVDELGFVKTGERGEFRDDRNNGDAVSPENPGIERPAFFIVDDDKGLPDGL